MTAGCSDGGLEDSESRGRGPRKPDRSRTKMPSSRGPPQPFPHSSAGPVHSRDSRRSRPRSRTTPCPAPHFARRISPPLLLASALPASSWSRRGRAHGDLDQCHPRQVGGSREFRPRAARRAQPARRRGTGRSSAWTGSGRSRGAVSSVRRCQWQEENHCGYDLGAAVQRARDPDVAGRLGGRARLPRVGPARTGPARSTITREDQLQGVGIQAQQLKSHCLDSVLVPSRGWWSRESRVGGSPPWNTV